MQRFSLSVSAFALASALLVASVPGHAFCGFYVAGSDAQLVNRATNVVLMRDGTRTVLTMQNTYEGPPENFAMVVPVPIVLERSNVRTIPNSIFARVDRLTAPRLVEYWEQDPCPSLEQQAYPPMGLAAGTGSGQGYGSGGGGLGVRVERRFEVGEYDVVVLSARDSSGLDTWLRQEHYHIPENAAPALAPYVRAGMKFFVARVNITRVRMEEGRARLSPLRFHYDSDSFSLPVRLGLINSPGTQDLLVHIIAPRQRYEVANRPNVTIPTNLNVTDGVRTQFGAFYAALFDRTLAQNPNAVVTEYAWDTGNCDPCPSPPLRDEDLATLGADVLPTTASVLSTAGIRAQIGADAPPTPVSRVRVRPPTVTGLLSPEAIRRVVLRNLSVVQACHAQALQSNPTLEGELVISFSIGTAGRVMTATAEPGVVTSAVGECVAQRVRSFVFPAPESGSVAVRYPYALAVQQASDAPAVGFGFAGVLRDLVVTRLHARYGRELAEDLVFRAARAITGGREEPSANGTLSETSAPSESNNFQARYAIRHPWTGPITCANPRRGIWGGPPNGGENTPQGARDLAFAPRGGVQLAQLLAGAAAAAPTPAPAVRDAGVAPSPAPRATPPAPQRTGSCAVSNVGTQGMQGLSAFLLALTALVQRERLRRRTRSRME